MKCEYCGKESPGRFCSRECWEAVNGFDEELKAERSVEFTEKHEANLAEWVDGVRVGKQDAPPLTMAALVALADRDYRLPAVVAWAAERRTQEWIGNRLGISHQYACRLQALMWQVLQAESVTKEQA
jgi:hypothetical protein